jgi:hypothetical protein
MLKSSMLALTGAAALALISTAPAPVAAAPVHLMPAFGVASAEQNVVDVQYRRRHHSNRHHGRHHGNWNRRGRGEWLALGIGSAIVGGMIANQGSRQYMHASSAWDRCAERFRSLRSDGTYTTYDGRRVLCPYLR